MPRSVSSLALTLTLALSPAQAGEIDFNRDVRPILSNHCFACHGPDDATRKAKLRLDTPAGAAASGSIVAGKPGESELLRRVTTHDADELMPPAKTGKRLTAKEADTLARWVKEGAKDATHWSYGAPVRPLLPSLRTPHTALRTPIDAVVLARLQQDGLTFSPEADRTTLVRRLSLDLTGLPPTPEEADAFANDPAPDAYEKLVDRLLASPAYGEHWARQWLDLARYADSAGYADDPPRTIWAFRDYVIRSLNANKPFDAFTVEQIAGDLLPNPTQEQLTATAFHRNTMTNNEGGTNDEEFRNVAVVDRVNTTLTVWMGVSAACAQCHTHKYDPISQREYFGLFAVFNTSADADRGDESPVLTLADPDAAKRAPLEAEAAALEKKLKGQKADALKPDRDRLAALKRQIAGMKPTTVPVMREQAANQRRKTRLQHRGNFLELGEEVPPGVPACFPPLPAGAAGSSPRTTRSPPASWRTAPGSNCSGTGWYGRARSSGRRANYRRTRNCSTGWRAS